MIVLNNIKYFTTEELKELFGVKKDYIAKEKRELKLPYSTIGKNDYYSELDLITWFENNKHTEATRSVSTSKKKSTAKSTAKKKSTSKADDEPPVEQPKKKESTPREQSQQNRPQQSNQHQNSQHQTRSEVVSTSDDEVLTIFTFIRKCTDYNNLDRVRNRLNKITCLEQLLKNSTIEYLVMYAKAECRAELRQYLNGIKNLQDKKCVS